MENVTINLPSSVGMYKNVSQFLERADRRTVHYKKVVIELERVEKEYGKDSKEVNEFFLSSYNLTNEGEM